MKRIFSLLLVITLATTLLLSACTSPEVPESGEAQEPVESVESSDLPEDVGEEESVEDEQKETPPEEEMSENVEIQEEDEDEPELPELTAADIGMTEDEFYAVVKNLTDEYKKLVLDFLYYDDGCQIGTYEKIKLEFPDFENKIIFNFNTDNMIESYCALCENDELFYIVFHDTIKTYDDLYETFNEICTPEFSTRVLNSVYEYADIDGHLCFHMSTGGGRICTLYYDAGVTSFSVLSEDEIILYFDSYMYFDGFSIQLKKINDNWLISSHAPRDVIKYYW